MAKLEHRIRLASGLAISLIVSGGFLYFNAAVERVLHLPINQQTVSTLRATLITTAIITCFLVMVANYLAVRVAIMRTTHANPPAP